MKVRMYQKPTQTSSPAYQTKILYKKRFMSLMVNRTRKTYAEIIRCFKERTFNLKIKTSNLSTRSENSKFSWDNFSWSSRTFKIAYLHVSRSPQTEMQPILTHFKLRVRTKTIKARTSTNLFPICRPRAPRPKWSKSRRVQSLTAPALHVQTQPKKRFATIRLTRTLSLNVEVRKCPKNHFSCI